MYNLVIVAILYVCSFILTAHAEITGAVRDPTLQHSRRGQPQAVNTFVQIDAIVYSKNPNNSFAIIEGKQVRANDKVKGATVQEIQPERIILKDQNGEFSEFMRYSEIKSPSKTTIKKKKK